MPIKGMTDTQRAAFPRLGVLRKGAPKPTSGNQPGKDLKWFRFVTDDQDAMKAFVDHYGPNPAHVTVHLPFATTDENFEAWMEEWGAGSLKHRCDGETCVIWQDEHGQYQHVPKDCPGGCSPAGRLMVIVPELRRLAYVQVLTTSKHDIVELTANLRAAEDTARLMGRDLRGIPFILTRVPRKISTPRENGKRVRIEKWLLHIEPAPSWVSLQIEAAQRMAMPQIEGPMMDIVPPANGDDEEAEVVEAEEVGTMPGGNGKTPRPLEPDTLRDYLHRRVAGDNGTQATEAQIPFVARKFQECFAPDNDADKQYHTALLWLWGIDSAKKLTKKKAQVTLDWLLDPDGPDDSGDTPLHEHSSEEARRVVRVALQEAGQLDMFGEEEIPF